MINIVALTILVILLTSTRYNEKHNPEIKPLVSTKNKNQSSSTLPPIWKYEASIWGSRSKAQAFPKIVLLYIYLINLPF